MRCAIACAVVTIVSVQSPASGASPTYEVTVSAGAHDRRNTPVSVALPAAPLPDGPRTVALAGPDGSVIPAQLTQPALLSEINRGSELHFVLPKLKAGKSLSLIATVSGDTAAGDESFAWHDHPGDFTVLQFGSRPVLRYQYRALDESTKENRERTDKVFHHVYSPQGDRIVTGGLSSDPDVHSPHHRGIFFGYNRITYGDGKTSNTWHCEDGSFQLHAEFLESAAGPVLGRHQVEIAWHGPDRHAFAREQRELTVYHLPGGHLIDFASLLSANDGTVILDGDPQHAGVHFRADNEVFAKTSDQTIYVRPDGVGQPGETRNWDPQTGQGPVNLPWDAMSFVLGFQRYTVACLNHPQNPGESRHSEREFGRFGSYFKYTLEPDRPLRVRYRYWLQDELMTPEQAVSLNKDFVQPVAVTVQAR